MKKLIYTAPLVLTALSPVKSEATIVVPCIDNSIECQQLYQKIQAEQDRQYKNHIIFMIIIVVIFIFLIVHFSFKLGRKIFKKRTNNIQNGTKT
ncbi:MAG: hypothetical protein KBD52_02835 [Candidatus Pacebacteria bacterium]|nr:hypothetical protein [Candidatus Paceibacterota bacterium]